MRGPEAARDAVAAWIAEALPGKLGELETRLDLVAGSLGVPVTVAGYDTGPLGIDQLPAVVVDQASLTRVQSDSRNDVGAEEFVTRYTVRLLTWIRADGYALTDQLGMRWALAVLEVLLSRARLDDSGARTDPRSIVQDYSGVLNDTAAGGQLCGCSTTLTVIMDETMDGPPLLGEADTFTLAIGLLTRDTGGLLTPSPSDRKLTAMALVFNPAPGQVQVDTAGHILEPFAELDVDPADPIAAAAITAGRIVLVDRRYADNVRPVDPDATTEES